MRAGRAWFELDVPLLKWAAGVAVLLGIGLALGGLRLLAHWILE